MSARAIRWETWALNDEGDRRFRRIFVSVILPLLVLAIVVPLIHLQGVKRGGGTYNGSNYVQLLPPQKQAPPAAKPEEPKPAIKPQEMQPPVKPVETHKPIPKLVQPKPLEKPRLKAVPKPNPAEVARRKAEAARHRAESLLQSSGLDQLSGLRDNTLASVNGRRPLVSGQLTTKGAAGSSGNNAAQQAIDRSATSTSAGIGNTAAAPITSAQSGEGVGTRHTAAVRGPAGFGRDHRHPGLNGDKSINGRSLQEIQLVFDRNKAAFYSLYNRALRQNPNEQGKIVVSITIAPDGHVTDCHMVYSNLGDHELEAEVIERVKMLNFGRKNVPAFTYPNYPIHFVPPS